ncbi:MAG: hypothetical protein ACI9OJ_001164 [Myxococcota bacterium]|jgi:hypothetical protein
MILQQLLRITTAVLLLVAVACQPEPATIEIGGPDSDDGTSKADTEQGAIGSCPPGASLGCVTPYSRKVCNSAGTELVEDKCPNGQVCFTVDGTATCLEAKCVPNTKVCQSPNTVGTCRTDGAQYETTETCGTGLFCSDGSCVSTCQSGVKAKSNVGCSYALVDLGNFESEPSATTEDNPVIVVVSNTSGMAPANITITSSQTEDELELTPEEAAVPPGGLKTYLLPIGFAQLETAINRGSWLLRSDQPITVHLINPENGLHVRSNDATLLFPTDAVGNDYIVMGWKSFWTEAQGLDENNFPKYGFESYVTVIATSAGSTKVTLTPTADIRAGKNKDGTLLERVPAGNTVEYTLESGDVLNYATEPQIGTVDLTGTQVKGDKAIAVFMAHNCAFVPSIDVPFCDHLEHQLAPIDTWGLTYVADLFQPRAETAYDVWRVMASQDQTVIGTDPEVPEMKSVILNKGEWVEYQASKPHLIKASAPIQVGHFMTGSNFDNFEEACGDTVKTGIGDPAFTVGVALNQYLDNYLVLTPPGYAQDYLNITREIGLEVFVDGIAVVEIGEPMGSTGLELVRVAVPDGVHRIEAVKTFGVTAYGYDCDVSYAYPGGMTLEGI